MWVEANDGVKSRLAFVRSIGRLMVAFPQNSETEFQVAIDTDIALVQAHIFSLA